MSDTARPPAAQSPSVKPPAPGSRFGTLEGYAQQTHELAAGMADDLWFDLCDPDADMADIDEKSWDVINAYRLFHDEAIRHGAICDGIHAVDDEDDGGDGSEEVEDEGE